MFSPNDFLPLESMVLNTEAHILPRFKLARGLKTGWKRKPRDAEGHIQQPRDKEKPTQIQPVKVQETAPESVAESERVSEGHVGRV